MARFLVVVHSVIASEEERGTYSGSGSWDETVLKLEHSEARCVPQLVAEVPIAFYAIDL